MIIDLTWENYLEFNNYLKTHKFKDQFLSAVNIASWVYYGINFKYHIIDDNHAILYIDYHFNAEEVKHVKPEYWYVSACLYNEHSDLELIKRTIKEDLMELNNDPQPIFSYITEEMITDFELQSFTNLHSFISNYLYDIEKMKTFGGRKLQKKRNHLNAFMQQNYDIQLKSIKDVKTSELFAYLEEHMKKYAEVYRKYEIDVYHRYLENEIAKSEKYFGTVVYINGKIVALTLCYLHAEVCEVLIEKAEHDIRGLYQFLIKENLLMHDVNVQYMDRQDDMELESLAQSKRSYYPVVLIKRYIVHNLEGGE